MLLGRCKRAPRQTSSRLVQPSASSTAWSCSSRRCFSRHAKQTKRTERFDRRMDLPPPFPDPGNIFDILARPKQPSEHDVTLHSKSTWENDPKLKERLKVHPAEDQYIHPLARGILTKQVSPTAKYNIFPVADFRMLGDLFFDVPPKDPKARRFLMYLWIGAFWTTMILWEYRHKRMFSSLAPLAEVYQRYARTDKVTQKLILAQAFNNIILQPIGLELVRLYMLRVIMAFRHTPLWLAVLLGASVMAPARRFAMKEDHNFPYVIDLCTSLAWLWHSNYWVALATHYALWIPFSAFMFNDRFLNEADRVKKSPVDARLNSATTRRKYKVLYDQLEDRMDDTLVANAVEGKLGDLPAGMEYECSVCSHAAVGNNVSFPTKGAVLMHTLVYHEGMDLKQVKKLIDEVSWAAWKKANTLEEAK